MRERVLADRHLRGRADAEQYRLAHAPQIHTGMTVLPDE
jgi:hypothetical protein